MKKLILLFLFGLLSGWAHGTIWYVTTSGSNSNACTQAAPCATPDFAFNNRAVPGDTVLVGVGTYSYGSSEIHLTNSGSSAGGNITLTCATRGRCLITSITGCTSVGVNCNQTVVSIDGNFTTFDGFEVTDTNPLGNNLGIYMTGSFLNITRNTVHNIQGDCGSNGTSAIHVAGSGGSAGVGHDIIIDANLIYDINYTSAGGFRCGPSVVQSDGILSESAGANIRVTNNIVYHSGGGWGIGIGPSTGVSAPPEFIANNLVFSNSNGGIILTGAVAGSVISNNIAFNNGLVAPQCGITVSDQTPVTYVSNDTFGNNGSNYCTNFGTPISDPGVGDISVNPALGTTFVNWQSDGSGDYHERSGGPTVATGSSNSAPNHDFDGNSRPSGGGFDIGPYQVTAAPVVAAPTASPVAGNYTGTQTITLSSTTPGAVFCYRTDGVNPTAPTAGTCGAGSTTYGGSITVATTTTILALGTEAGFTNSTVANFPYTITPATVAVPTASPAPGSYLTTQSVTLSDTTSGAVICYRSDGVNPAATTAGACDPGSTTYSGPISVSTTRTIKALGTHSGQTNSAVASFAYRIGPAVTWYVTTSGSDSNPCTLASPCATPDFAFNNRAFPGDTVQVGGGTYAYGSGTATFNTSGATGNYITTTCVTRGACLITNTATGTGSVVTLNGQYQIFDGFEVTNTNVTGLNVGVAVTNNFIKVTRNNIHDIQTDCTSSVGSGGIVVAGSSGGGSVHDLLIDANTIYNIAYTVGGGAKCGSGVFNTEGIFLDTFGDNITVSNNLTYSISGGWGIYLGNSASTTSGTNNFIVFNTIFNTGDGGILVTSHATNGVTIADDIILNTGFTMQECGIMDSANNGAAVYHANDLFNNNGGNYCVNFATGTNAIMGGDIAVDPALGTTFVNWQFAGTGNYHEKAGAPTINTGVTAGSVNHDHDGIARPGTGGFDMGAYQYVPPVGGTLQSITLLPPASGYIMVTNTSTVQLTPLCTYTGGTPAPDNCASQTLTWGSTVPSTMTVNSSGLATGAGGPTCTAADIFAYSGNIIGHHQILVECSPIASLATRPGSLGGLSTNVVLGSTVLLSAVDNNNNAVGDFVAWTTANAGIATVNNIGEVTAVGVGTTTVTATLDAATVGRTITVVNPATALVTYYVRPGGGNRLQCDGTVDVDLAGSSGGHCAVNEIMYCFTDDTGPNTSLVHAGDTCFVHSGKLYSIGNKNFSTAWNPGALGMPSGTPAHPTRLIADCSPVCSSDPDNAGNRVLVTTWGSGNANVLAGAQNEVMEGFDITSGEDCGQSVNGNFDFLCPTGHVANWVLTDSFASNIKFNNLRIHGHFTGWNGTPGPGIQFNGTAVEFNALDGLNFDHPFGENGNRTDGFTAVGFSSKYNGCSECQPKTMTSVSRGGGNLNITFAAGQIVNYVVGNNIVLAGMIPVDLNGTYPVSAITFNQQTVTITGTSCNNVPGGISPVSCVFTTSAAPSFGVGAFVQLAGSFSPAINGTIDKYEVQAVSGTGFTIVANFQPRPGWPGGPVNPTCSGTCTASTANSLVATAAGAVEAASTLGTASFVHPAHRCMDQGDGGSSNGDGVGTGNNTIGSWFCDKCLFADNLQDGWDMLHSAMATSTFTNSVSTGNEGQAAKMGNADVINIWNDILIANCSSLLAFDPNKPPDFNQYIATQCRANDTFPIFSRAWTQAIISNVTFGPGNQNLIWDDFCQDGNPGCGSAHLPMASYVSQNNLFIGFNDLNNPVYDGSPPSIYFSDIGITPNWSWLNNMAFNTRNPPGGGSGNNYSLVSCPIIGCPPDISTFPNETQARVYNYNITTGSAAYHAGVSNAFTPATDLNGTLRSGSPSIGALEPVGGGATLSSITVLPNPAAVTTTTSVNMQTSSFCTFSDSSTIPAGSSGCVVVWSDTSVHSSINSSTGVVTGSSVGSDTVTATLSPATPGTATVNVSSSGTVAPPTAAPPAGTYTTTQTVALSDATPSSAICFTTDGSTPTAPTAGTCSGGTTQTYTTTISVAASETIKAIGTRVGFANSTVASFAYVIQPTTATPTAAPVAGTYNVAQSIVLSDATGGAAICFTTDGTNPTAPVAGTCSGGSTQTYSTPIAVAVSGTIKAIGTHTGNTNSAVATFVYIITPAIPPALSGTITITGTVPHLP